MDHGMQVVGELRQLTALDLSMVFNATGARPIPFGGSCAMLASGLY